MDIASFPIDSGTAARERCIVRGQRLVHVKFIGLQEQGVPEVASGETRASGRASQGVVSRLISRVIGRLVAARP
jgi:hypothetical protein